MTAFRILNNTFIAYFPLYIALFLRLKDEGAVYTNLVDLLLANLYHRSMNDNFRNMKIIFFFTCIRIIIRKINSLITVTNLLHPRNVMSVLVLC